MILIFDQDLNTSEEKNNNMLSRKEREYLQGNFIPTNAHKRVLNHKIRKKLQTLLKLELPLMQNSYVTEISNYVTKFGNVNSQNMEVPEGVEPPCISFAGSRMTVLPEYRFEKHEMNN